MRTEKKNHPNFDKYVEEMVKHPNYNGLFYTRDANGKVKWVVPGKSENGKKRESWWNIQCKKFGVDTSKKGCYAKIARKIHPTGVHVCQCCGKESSIFYEYPTKNTAKKLNDILCLNIDSDSDRQRVQYTIKELITQHCKSSDQITKLSECFSLPKPWPNTLQELINAIYEEHVKKESSMLSPGVMSNSPDRFDGFHSYGLCCRTENDKGRSSENLSTYSQDRRAYENWSDGNYNLANRLMGEFHKQAPMKCPICGKIDKMSADHIGPISLGFCHSVHFAPMCNSCNSAKNNRFTKSDVDELLKLEQKGFTVISWHSKYIWDQIKNKIATDEDAKFASAIMAKCHQNILNVLAIIYNKTGTKFLKRYLHPEYSMYDYRFENVNLLNLEQLKIKETPLDSKNKRNNQVRYMRIAFESLDEFLKKTNRKNYFLINADSKELEPLIKLIVLNKYCVADKYLKRMIQNMSIEIYKRETVLQHFSSEKGEEYM